MITVSDSFKKAIKSDTREIYGYVEVKYQNKNFDLEVNTIPTSSPLTKENGIVQDNKILQKYASLENNYTLLDGSFMVWNENNILDKGYISDDIFNDMLSTQIVITNDDTTTTTKGITIYFKENLPFSFTVTITDVDGNVITDDVTNNQSYVYQYIFANEIVVSYISIDITSVEFPQNRLRIASIDFNLSDFYEGEELVNFEITEELDLLLESIPINNCSVKLNNYPDYNGKSKFDILNPQGITAFLTDNVQVKPYVGVLTEENGIEYVPMGVFYLTDWSSDNDGNVTFNTCSIFNKFESKSMIVDQDFLWYGVSPRDIKNMIKNQIDADVDFDWHQSNVVSNNALRNPNLSEYIKHAIPQFLLYLEGQHAPYVFHFRKFYINRYGVITFNELSEEILGNFSREFLKQDLIYTNLNDIKYLKIKYDFSKGDDTTSNYTVLSQSYILKNEESYAWFTIDEFSLSMYNTTPTLTYTVTSGSGTATLIAFNYNMILIKFTGSIGSEFSITCTAKSRHINGFNSNEIVIENDVENGDTITMDFSEYGFGFVESSNLYHLPLIYFNLSPKYKISAETMGDPSLEIGDTINIQTKYQDINNGYKKMIITKQQFTYNGGLECSIEGVGR